MEEKHEAKIGVIVRSKRAQSGSAATVVGIIALLLVFYILFIPPADRAALLYGTDENGTYIGGTTHTNRTLLLANVGKLDYIAEDSYDHLVPNVILTETKGAQVLTTFSPFVLRHGLFENEPHSATFNILDPDKTGNVMLVFEAPVREGVLTVVLNDQVIFEGALDSQTPAPIALRRAQLGASNTLRFETSGSGLAVWSVNEMRLTNIHIIGDVSDASLQRSTSTFTLLDEEARNMKKATLFFYPVCERGTVGLLDAHINDAKVFSGKPDCEQINMIELDTDAMHSGANTLGLRVTAGNARIENIRIKTELKDTKSYIDYFELNASDMARIDDGRRKAVIHVKFVDDGEDKIGTVNVNGHLSNFDQRNASYSKDISMYVQEGNNYLALRPESVLNIVKLDVRLE